MNWEIDKGKGEELNWKETGRGGDFKLKGDVGLVKKSTDLPKESTKGSWSSRVHM